MADKKESQAKKMYGHSPKTERDEESGKVVVKKASKGEEDAEGENESGSGETTPVMARHSMERMDMNHAHEREHMMHDHGKGGDKKDMHDRHEKMRKELHARHEKEMGKGEKTPEMGKEKE